MLNSRTTGGYPFHYFLSTLFFLMALAGIILLIVTDALHRYSSSALHEHLDAVPLIAIGLSYITLQCQTGRKVDVKGVFLGVAFLLWGGEQLLPPSQLSTLMDEGAVTIFVVDLSLIIWGRLTKPEASRLP